MHKILQLASIFVLRANRDLQHQVVFDCLNSTNAIPCNLSSVKWLHFKTTLVTEFVLHGLVSGDQNCAFKCFGLNWPANSFKAVLLCDLLVSYSKVGPFGASSQAKR